jgi:hypothetical protein
MNRNSDFSVDDRVLAFERGVVLGDYCELYSRRRGKMTWGSMGVQCQCCSSCKMRPVR